MPDIVVKFLSHSERENQFIIIKTEVTDINHFCSKQHCTFSCPNLLPEIPAEVYVGIPLLMKFSSYEGENTVEYRG